VQHNKRVISIFKEDRVGGRARVTIDEERVMTTDSTEITQFCGNNNRIQGL